MQVAHEEELARLQAAVKASEVECAQLNKMREVEQATRDMQIATLTAAEHELQEKVTTLEGALGEGHIEQVLATLLWLLWCC